MLITTHFPFINHPIHVRALQLDPELFVSLSWFCRLNVHNFLC